MKIMIVNLQHFSVRPSSNETTPNQTLLKETSNHLKVFQTLTQENSQSDLNESVRSLSKNLQAAKWDNILWSKILKAARLSWEKLNIEPEYYEININKRSLAVDGLLHQFLSCEKVQHILTFWDGDYLDRMCSYFYDEHTIDIPQTPEEYDQLLLDEFLAYELGFHLIRKECASALDASNLQNCQPVDIGKLQQICQEENVETILDQMSQQMFSVSENTLNEHLRDLTSNWLKKGHPKSTLFCSDDRNIFMRFALFLYLANNLPAHPEYEELLPSLTRQLRRNSYYHLRLASIHSDELLWKISSAIPSVRATLLADRVYFQKDELIIGIPHFHLTLEELEIEKFRQCQQNFRVDSLQGPREWSGTKEELQYLQYLSNEGLLGCYDRNEFSEKVASLKSKEGSDLLEPALCYMVSTENWVFLADIAVRHELKSLLKLCLKGLNDSTNCLAIDMKDDNNIIVKAFFPHCDVTRVSGFEHVRASGLWTHTKVIKAQDPYSNNFPQLLPKTLTHLDLTKYEPRTSDIQTISESCPGLKHLSIGSCGHVRSEDWKKLSLPNLECLNIKLKWSQFELFALSGLDLKALEPQLPNLKFVKLKVHAENLKSDEFHFLRQIPVSIELSIVVDGYARSNFIELAHASPSLRELCSSNQGTSVPLTADEHQAFSENCIHLRKLHVVPQGKWNEDDLAKLGNGFPELTELLIANCGDERVILEMINKCPKLQKLTLFFCECSEAIKEAVRQKQIPSFSEINAESKL